MPQMKAKLRRMRNLGLVVIDYIQLMQSANKNASRVEAVSEITRSLKLMAKELNVPVIALSQLSRSSEKRDDKRPILQTCENQVLLSRMLILSCSSIVMLTTAMRATSRWLSVSLRKTVTDRQIRCSLAG